MLHINILEDMHLYYILYLWMRNERKGNEMKKFFICLLICTMLISFTSCGGANEATTNENASGNTASEESSENTDNNNESNTSSSDWFFPTSVDEFGDVVESDTISIASIASGDFSNTATSSSDLKVETIFGIFNGHRVFSFYLNEYNDTLATYLNSSDISMKVKFANDNTSEYTVYGSAPNGPIILGATSDDGDGIFNELASGNDVKCVIYIDNSKYNFTLSSNGFREICDEAQQKSIEKNKVADPTDAIKAFIERKNHGNRYNYLVDNMESFPIVSTEDLKDLIKGNWLSIQVENVVYDDWWFYQYTDKERLQIGRFVKDDNGDYQYETTENFPKTYKIEDNQLIITNSKGDVIESYEFRKLKDGHYFVVETQNKSHYNVSTKEYDPYMYLYVQYGEDGKPLYPAE